MAHEKNGKISKYAYHYGFQLVAVGLLTGFFAGLVVTLYNLLATFLEEFARGYYGFFRDNPAFLPLLFVALFLGAVIIGGFVRFLPIIRGSGIPQTEGATRGLIHFKWYQALTGMFAASLITIFMGLTVGAEGPSIMIGGSCGYGVSRMTRRGEMVRRYQITGGACAGLAVAFNAPLTGMAFAFEEAHKRFTPEVFICSFSSVIVAIVTRNVLYTAFGLSVGSVFDTFSFTGTTFQLPFLLYVGAAAIVCGLAGVAFYYLAVKSRKLFDKITFWKGAGKMIIPFFLAGIFGMISLSVIGGGHSFIESLGSLSEGIENTFTYLWLTLLIIVLLRFLATATNIGAGVPGGAFIPMLAIGAGIGAILSEVFCSLGMDEAYRDLFIIICMAVFFTTVVRAPITAIVMTVELTWNFTFLLPVIIGVAIGYLIGDLCRTEPIYEKQLDRILADERKGQFVKISVTSTVKANATAEGRAVRDVLWPANALVTAVHRGEQVIIPDGKTVLEEGDILYINGETSNSEEFVKMLSSMVGETVVLKKEDEEQGEQPQTE